MTIRVDISALLEQVLGRFWGVENDYYLTENFDGHDLACGYPKSAQSIMRDRHDDLPYCRPHSVNVIHTKFFGNIRKWPISGNPRGPGGYGSLPVLRRERKAVTRVTKTTTAKTSKSVILDKCMSRRKRGTK